MVPAPDRYTARIRALRPDLDLTSARLNADGLVNDVVIVQDAWVFRFAKDENGLRALAAELKVLSALRGRLPIALPDPEHVERDLMVYRLLPGAPLSRAGYLALDAASRRRLASSLAACLQALHTTPLTDALPRTLAPVTRAVWQDRRARIEARIFPLLLPHQRAWAQALLDGILADPGAFDFQPALIHGDLAPYHLLHDPATGRLTGLIDFGVAGVGDPANDLAVLAQSLGESFLADLAPIYPLPRPLLKRTRFYAQALELEWVLNGLETGETFWFTAHLGGARDLGA